MVRRAATDDRGSAVAEFALVLILLIVLLLGVLQVAVYLHVRNVVAASAAEGARYAANADVGVAAGAPRSSELIGRSLGARTQAKFACTAAPQVGAGGTTLVAVRCQGALTVFFAPLGRLLPVDVTARALKEGT